MNENCFHYTNQNFITEFPVYKNIQDTHKYEYIIMVNGKLGWKTVDALKFELKLRPSASGLRSRESFEFCAGKLCSWERIH